MPTYFPQKPPLGVPVDWGHPHAQGLVGCWLFNEGGGDKVNDLSGNSSAGTLTNMEGSDWFPGARGMAIATDATNEYVNCGDGPSLNLTGSMTIASWLMRTGTGGAYLCGKIGASGTRAYGLYNVNADTVRVYVASNATTVAYRPSLPQGVQNVWEHWAAVYDAGLAELHIYYNGVLADSSLSGTVPATQYSANGLSFCIGAAGSGYAPAASNFESLYVYNRAFSAAQVMDLYANSYAMFRPPSSKWATMYVAPAGGEEITITRATELFGAETQTLTRGIALSGSEAQSLTRSLATYGADPQAITRALELVASEQATLTRALELAASEGLTLTRGLELLGADAQMVARAVALYGADAQVISRALELLAAEEQTLARALALSGSEQQTILRSLEAYAAEAASLTRAFEFWGTGGAEAEETFLRGLAFWGQQAMIVARGIAVWGKYVAGPPVLTDTSSLPALTDTSSYPVLTDTTDYPHLESTAA